MTSIVKLLILVAVVSCPVTGKLFNPFGWFSNIIETVHQLVSHILEPVTSTVDAFFETIGHCAVHRDPGFRHRRLGNFLIHDNSVYCDSSCSRSTLCCAPEPPSKLQVNFYHYNSQDTAYRLSLQGGGKRVSAQLVARAEKIIWYVHGFKTTMYNSPQSNETKDAFLRRGYDAILVDWHKGNNEYFQSIANVRIVGALMGHMMQELNVISKSTCIGFSLGAHICGEAGTWLRLRGKVLPRCIGIDPAGPGFDGCSDRVRLDKTDCTLVTSIHTSQFQSVTKLLANDGAGTKEKTGHCDFWANRGKEQPSCPKNVFGASCSHNKGMDYYLSQIRRDCNFIGSEAECLGEAEICNRTRKNWRQLAPGQKLLKEMPIPPDDKCTDEYDMDYQFHTKPDAPFC